MRAIITKYNGYSFRSRLEARWAVFFDTIKVKYEYEMEGFTNDNICYLPDFYFPDYDLFAEIKPVNHGDEDMNKWLMLAETKQLILLEGAPHCKPSRMFGVEKFTIQAIPFINIVNQKYGYYWHCSGCENFGQTEPFLEGIIKSRSARFDKINNLCNPPT